MEVHQKRLHMKGRAPQFPVGKIGKGVFGWIGERGKGPSVANPFPYSWEKRGGGGPCIFHPSENPKSVSGLRERESKRWRERRGGGRLRKREIRSLPPSVSDLTWAAKKNRLKGWRKREGKEKSQRGIRRVSARDPSDSLGCRDFFFGKPSRCGGGQGWFGLLLWGEESPKTKNSPSFLGHKQNPNLTLVSFSSAAKLFCAENKSSQREGGKSFGFDPSDGQRGRQQLHPRFSSGDFRDRKNRDD